MRNLKVSLVLALAWMVAAPGLSQDIPASLPTPPPLSLEERMGDFQTLVQAIRAKYGPLQYKQDVIGINVSANIADYAQKIQNARSDAEFYYLINQFTATFKDSHFGARLPSRFAAILPFTTDLVEGRVLVDEVLPIPGVIVDIRKGDEILALNEQPIDEVLTELSRYFGHGSLQTTRKLATYLVGFRPGRIVPVPNGNVEIIYRNSNSGGVFSVTVPWFRMGEALDEDFRQRAIARVPRQGYGVLSVADVMSAYRHPRAERSYSCNPGTRIELPPGATVISEKPIMAYYYPTQKGNLGYLRIPDYMAVDEATGESQFEIRFRQFQFVVNELERNTVGLVIDQDHNCGGSVTYLHQLLSLFAREPFRPAEFQLRGSKTEYLGFRAWAEAEPELTLDRAAVGRVLNLIQEAWRQGHFLTSKTAIDGSEIVFPNPVRYTKPVVILMDEMAGSGGDMFPAMMKGLGRAKLIGTRTMGAGGHVEQLPPLPSSSINIHMTRSLFFRPDGVAVENNGAVPDIPYAITTEDFLNSYRPYRDFYTQQLLNEIN